MYIISIYCGSKFPQTLNFCKIEDTDQGAEVTIAFCNVFDYLMGKRKTSKGKFNHLAIDLMLWVIGTTECGNHDSFDLYRQVLLWVHRPEPIWIIEVILAVFTFSKALLFIFISKVSWFCFVHLLLLVVSFWLCLHGYRYLCTVNQLLSVCEKFLRGS